MKRFFLLLTFAIVLLAASVAQKHGAFADEGWVIKTFAVDYKINQDSTVDVVEDIRVDFGGQSKHGIVRYIPIESKYDEKNNQRIKLDIVGVDDGEKIWPYTTSREGINVILKIGDPDHTISGPQRYRIRYRLTGQVREFEDHNEFYWNVNGNQSLVRTESVTASVSTPGLTSITCFQGPTGSNQPCNARQQGSTAILSTTRTLNEGEGLTVVIGMTKGVMVVPPPTLVRVKSAAEKARDFVGLTPLPIALAVLVAIGSIGMVLRYWWIAGRDRWYGDVHYLTGDSRERTKPLLAKDTIVVEYTPPEMPDKRRLRPAEIGTLLDESADTLDVSATIIDLGVRGYLKITEIPKEGLLGKKDYQLDKVKPSDGELLGYESQLHNSLFEDGDLVLMSALKNKFYTDLAEVKTQLYDQVVKTDDFFAGSPSTVRTVNAVAGVLVMVLGAGAVVGLGNVAGAAIVGVPIIFAGLLLLALSHAMPRRTGTGREMYRRCLGFREYMTVAETDRQKFYEEENVFEKYLPYAIVYHCVDKWAKVFDDLGLQTQTSGWYAGSGPFLPLAFATSINSFSDSISSSISSTPGGSGGSGFSGGFSGGGGGGGGVGSW